MTPVARRMLQRALIILAVMAAGLLSVVSLFVSFKTPRHDRRWELGQEKLPKIVVEGADIRVHDLRDFTWLKDEAKTSVNYVERRFKIGDIEGLDVVISHFAEQDFLAHDFLNFRLKDQEDIGISIETRRELGESFNPFKGLFNAYELIYVVGSYSDLINLRKDIRGERVYVHPTVARPEAAQELFLALAADINALRETPRFYNTLTNNCTNILARKVESLNDVEIPYFQSTLAPGHLHESLYDLDLIEKPGSFEETKAQHLLK